MTYFIYAVCLFVFFTWNFFRSSLEVLKKTWKNQLGSQGGAQMVFCYFSTEINVWKKTFAHAGPMELMRKLIEAVNWMSELFGIFHFINATVPIQTRQICTYIFQYRLVRRANVCFMFTLAHWTLDMLSILFHVSNALMIIIMFTIRRQFHMIILHAPDRVRGGWWC